MAPDIAKVDADRDLNLGLSAWDFSDEVLRWLLHEKQSLRSGRPAHPISRYKSQLITSNLPVIRAVRKYEHLRLTETVADSGKIQISSTSAERLNGLKKP
jgi:hypothetical protein